MERFTGHTVEENEVQEFLQSIDEDNDALIQIDELNHFISRGITLSNEGRKDYSSRGSLHRTILEFFDGAIEKLKIEQENNELSNYIEPWLETLFPIYDEVRRIL